MNRRDLPCLTSSRLMHWSKLFGVAFGTSGYVQPQFSMVGSLIASTNDSYAAYFIGQDFQTPFLPRLFFEPFIAVGKFAEIESYTDGNPNFPDERAGSNDSDKNNFITTDGNDQWYRLTASYVLPIGSAEEDPITTVVLDKGLRLPGEDVVDPWNPLKTGKTSIELTPFYRQIDSSSEDLAEDVLLKTFGLEYTLRYSNLDFQSNPSRGSEQRFTIARDWGAADSSAPWTFWDLEASKFFSFGETSWWRQRVLAFNFWTGNTPTWDSSSIEDGQEIFHRPPYYAGATLGGVRRMRGYPTNRFNDQAVVYYAAEMRMIPHWNPLGEIDLLDFLQLDWWQFVGFFELGRVADVWTVEELHDDMKWDIGFGLRAMVKHLVVRADVATSEEDTNLQMFVSHPFSSLSYG